MNRLAAVGALRLIEVGVSHADTDAMASTNTKPGLNETHYAAFLDWPVNRAILRETGGISTGHVALTSQNSEVGITCNIRSCEHCAIIAVLVSGHFQKLPFDGNFRPLNQLFHRHARNRAQRGRVLHRAPATTRQNHGHEGRGETGAAGQFSGVDAFAFHPLLQRCRSLLFHINFDTIFTNLITVKLFFYT